MQNSSSALPLGLYYEHLTKINGVEFTPREIDVISCILNRRGNSIASFLSIGQRAVESHIRNIKHKAGGLTGREQIIDFIEKSGKLLLIKNEYYTSLRYRVLFEEKLEEISKQLDIKPLSCLLIYGKDQKNLLSLSRYLREHLKWIDFEIEAHQINLEESFLNQLLELINSKEKSYALCVLPNDFDYSQLTQINAMHPSNVIFLAFQDIQKRNAYPNLNFIKMEEGGTYYFSFFEILKKFFPTLPLKNISEEFKEQYELINQSSKIEVAQGKTGIIKQFSFREKIENFLKRRRGALWVGGSIVIGSLSAGFFISERKSEIKLSPTSNYSESSIRSDLILPTETTLLNRPELVGQISTQFKDQKAIQTIALVGIGGSGKTITARQYAYQQKANIVWEINAETNFNLIKSFESLAQALSTTEKDRKLLREVQEIKQAKEREKKIILFVKERLRRHSNWLLIYDNVEEFANIQPYFPQDMHTWGIGKVIITTQNHNIQNSRQINGLVLTGELNANQKLDLFMKIMHQEESYELATEQQKNLIEFLKQLPPFPLDISVAAYYLKTTNIPYRKYLERLEQQDKTFILVQENLLKNAGEYAKTRYGIITLALNELINKHNDFKDLILFISLLDSQNIPRDLLDLYKEKTIVDNFIYHLKKSSFIMREAAMPSIGSALSIHRSTQAIALAYLTQKLNLEKGYSSIEIIAEVLKNYMRNIIDTEDVSQMKAMVSHYKSFLSHKILRDSSSLELNSQIGCIYYFLGDYQQAQKKLENYFAEINLNNKKNAAQISQNLEVLGSVYRELGFYQEAVDYLNKSLQIYQTNFPQRQDKAATILTSLGNAYRNLGDVTTSKKLLHNSIAIYRQSPTKNYLGLARALGYLGNIYYIIGDFVRGRDLFKESILIHKKYCSKDNMDYARTLIYLGKVYIKLGDSLKAKIFTEQGLKVYKEYYGSNHINLSWALLHLGNVYQALGEHKQALSIVETIIESYKQYYGEQHIDTAWASMFLGEIYCLLGQYKKSIEVLQQSHAVHKQVFGADHIDTGAVLRELGKAYLLKGELDQAEKSISKSLKILNFYKHSDSYQCLELLATLYMKKSMEYLKLNTPQAQKLKLQAIKYLEDALDIVKTNFPEDSPHIVRIQGKLKKLQQG